MTSRVTQRTARGCYLSHLEKLPSTKVPSVGFALFGDHLFSISYLSAAFFPPHRLLYLSLVLLSIYSFFSFCTRRSASASTAAGCTRGGSSLRWAQALILRLHIQTISAQSAHPARITASDLLTTLLCSSSSACSSFSFLLFPPLCALSAPFFLLFPCRLLLLLFTSFLLFSRLERHASLYSLQSTVHGLLVCGLQSTVCGQTVYGLSVGLVVPVHLLFYRFSLISLALALALAPAPALF